MEKTGSIQKDKHLRPAQDFKHLMEKGLKYVQDFSGDIWTDYNSHDPGVTILEQFCYGLTELAYKTSFPIEDLLAEASEGRINWEKNSFYSPALVFSSHPYTVSDFRKLLIDSFPEIQNCWLSPVYPQGREDGINGVFRVEVLPALAFQKELKKRPESGKSFLKKLWKFLETNRNLGEDFDRPVLLIPHPVFLQASVEISPGEDADLVMAEIMFALEVFLYHPVAYSNLEELLNQGERAEDIFSGPRLTRGFIRDSELKDRSKVLYTEKFLQLISKIPGVKKCWNLALDKSGTAKVFTLPENSYASVNTDSTDPDCIYSTLKIFVNGNLQRLNRAKISDLLLDLWSKKYRVYQVDLFRETFWKANLKGRFRNPKKYHSIQHHFPGIYGLGNEGISSHEPLERHAKVRQLKGYLMLMEKHLANYLAQLAHLPDFFDHDITGLPGTYFAQDFESKIGNDELEIKENLYPGFDESGVNPQTGETRISWLRRKNRILDHLLARFGEEVRDLPFQLALKLNLLGNEEEMLAALLRQKSRFLQEVSELNYGKHRALFQDPVNGKQVSTLEKLLSLILGIDLKDRSLIPEFLPKNVSDYSAPEASGFLRSQSSYSDLTDKFRLLSKKERNFPLLPNPEKPEFSFGKIGIRDLFSRAVDPDSYWISREPSRVGLTEVLFQKSESNWVSVWEGRDENEAIRAIANNIQFFRAMNSSSEGMYLVDHILLRPLLEGGKFGFILLDEWGNPTFKSVWSTSREGRKSLLEKFYEAALLSGSYRKTGNSVALFSANGELLASFQGEDAYELTPLIESTAEVAMLMSGSREVSGFLSLSELERLRLKGTLHNQGVFRQRAVVFVSLLEDGSEIREDFFDLRATLVLPDWPVRFQESHFRFFLENEVRDRVPAHMDVQIQWLNLREMESFETIHSKWQGSVAESSPSYKQHLDSALKLYGFLSELRGGYDGR